MPLQDAPKSFQAAPRSSQTAPKYFPKSSKRLQKASKKLQNCLQEAPTTDNGKLLGTTQSRRLTIRGLKFTIYSSLFLQFTIHGAQSTDIRSSFTAHRLRFSADGSPFSVYFANFLFAMHNFKYTNNFVIHICKFPIHKSPIRDTDEDTKKYPVPKIIKFTAFPTSTLSIEDIGPPIAHSKTAVQTVDIDCLQPKRTSTSHCTSSQCTA